MRLANESSMYDASRNTVVSILTPGKPRESFEVVEGDITLPGLGLAPADHERLSAEVDTVFHLAAIYDLAVPAELAERVNVGGTERVNDFVRGLGRLAGYHYVSTYAVAGKRRGIVREARKQNLKMSAFVQGIANSQAFRMAAPDAPAPKSADLDKAGR